MVSVLYYTVYILCSKNICMLVVCVCVCVCACACALFAAVVILKMTQFSSYVKRDRVLYLDVSNS